MNLIRLWDVKSRGIRFRQTSCYRTLGFSLKVKPSFDNFLFFKRRYTIALDPYSSISTFIEMFQTLKFQTYLGLCLYKLVWEQVVYV